MRKEYFLPTSIFLVLTGLYFFTRLFLLKNLPLFVDEVIYVHWAQLGFLNASALFASLGDGKQPLFIWLVILVMHAIHNPAIAGRVAAIIAGFGTAIGMLFLTFALCENKWIALSSMLLYVFCPFSLIIDRLALYDSLVAMLAIWSLYLSILLVKRLQLGNALLLAFPLGAGILNKSSGFLSIYLLPLTLVVFENGKSALRRFLLWVFYATLAIVVALMYSCILFLSPDASNISTKNGLFLNSPLTLLTTNFFPLFFHNIMLFAQWIFLLFTPFFLILAGIGLTHKLTKEKLLLLIMFFIEIIGFAVLGKSIAPRYIFFMTMFLIPLAAMGLWYSYEFFQHKPFHLLLVFAIFFSFAFFSDYKILTNIEDAPIPSATKIQLVTGWAAGGGVGDIVKYLLKESQKQRIFVVTDGLYGSMSTGAMDLYFFNNQAVDRLTLDTFPPDVPQVLSEKAKKEPVYVFLNQLQTPPPWKMRPVIRFKKGNGSNYVSLYKLAPSYE